MCEEIVSARLFDCARCGERVCICTHCDRGNLYCGPGCAVEARQEGQQASGERYQGKEPGRTYHKLRQQRYAERRAAKMTHQGSGKPGTAVPLGSTPAGPPPAQPEEVPDGPEHNPASLATPFTRCSFCRCAIGAFVRFEFLKHPRPRQRRAPRLPVYVPAPA